MWSGDLSVQNIPTISTNSLEFMFIWVFQFLIGNKLGDATIPIEINQNEFSSLRKDAIKSGKSKPFFFL
jgi:hypothetical protein